MAMSGVTKSDSKFGRLRDLTGSNLPLVARCVWCAICDHGNDQGTAYLSMERIGEQCGITKRGARNAISMLLSAGYISVVGERVGAAAKRPFTKSTEFLKTPHHVHPFLCMKRGIVFLLYKQKRGTVFLL